MKSIIYEVIPDKIINGTLFYCLEYFLTSLEISKDVLLILYCSNKKQENIIKNAFNEKYNSKYLNENLENIKFCYDFKEMNYLVQKSRVLFLDIRSFNKFRFLSKDILVYAHNSIKIKPEPYIKIYGFFHYQHYNIKNRLKIGFKYHKIFNKNDNLIFDSSPNMPKTKNIFKQPNIFFNIFKHCSKIAYTQTSKKDTNNRITLEAIYHKKELEIFFNYKLLETFNDSLNDRIKLIYSKRLNLVELNKDDRIIQDFINI